MTDPTIELAALVAEHLTHAVIAFAVIGLVHRYQRRIDSVLNRIDDPRIDTIKKAASVAVTVREQP